MQKHESPQLSAVACQGMHADSTASDSAAYQWPCRASSGGSSSASTYTTVQVVSPLFVAGSAPGRLNGANVVAEEAGATTKKPLPLKSS